MANRPWTAAELADLRARRQRGETVAEVASALGRPYASTMKRVQQLHEPKQFRPWTEADDATLRELHAKGLNDRQVGERMGRHFMVIGRHRRRLGLPTNGYRLRKRRSWWVRLHEGRRRKERIAALLRDWHGAQTARQADVLDLLEQGPKTADDVAAALGVGKSTVWMLLRRMRSMGLVKRLLDEEQARGHRPKFVPWALGPRAKRALPKGQTRRVSDPRMVGVGD